MGDLFPRRRMVTCSSIGDAKTKVTRSKIEFIDDDNKENNTIKAHGTLQWNHLHFHISNTFHQSAHRAACFDRP